jgi:hypothetical protein
MIGGREGREFSHEVNDGPRISMNTYALTHITFDMVNVISQVSENHI